MITSAIVSGLRFIDIDRQWIAILCTRRLRYEYLNYPVPLMMIYSIIMELVNQELVSTCRLNVGIVEGAFFIS